MVKKIRQMFENMQKMMGGLSGSQRWTMLTGALMVFVALSALVFYATQTRFEDLVDSSQMESSDRIELQDYLVTNNIPTEIRGNVIMVEQGRRQEIMMNLNLDNKLAGTISAFKWLNDLSPMNTPTPDAMKERLRISTGHELEGTINSLSWVKSSKVTITTGADNHFLKGQRHPTKASVNIISRQRDIDDKDRQVKAVRSLMTFAVPRLKVENVGIVIDGTPYIFEQTSPAAQQYDEWTARKIKLEMFAEQKIKRFFLGSGGESGLVRRLRVNVHVKLNRKVIEQHTEKNIEEPLPIRSKKALATAKGSAPPSQEPGVVSNTSVAQNVALEGHTVLDTVDDTAIIEYKFGKESTIVFSEIPGAIDDVQVALVFDHEEILGPNVDMLLANTANSQIIQQKLSKYKLQVANSLGIKGELINNNISVDAMKFADKTLKEKAGLASVLMDVLEKSGGHFLLFGLSLFGFLYFVNVLRQAFDTPELEEEMDEDEIKRRTTDEDVARILDAQAESLDDIRARQVEERVRALVKENPTAAGSLLQRWMSEDAPE